MERQSIRFGFKETTKKDETTGKSVLDEKGEPVKIPAHNPVVIEVPQMVLNKGPNDPEGKPTFLPVSDDLTAIAQSGDEKLISLILDAANEVVLKHMKLQLDDAIKEGKNVWPTIEKVKDANGKEVEVISAPADISWIDYDKLQLSYIANLPPSQRGAAGIAEETWDAFAKDYKAVIVRYGKTNDQAEAATKHFLNKFAVVRLNKKVLKALETNLNLWYQGTTEDKQVEFVKIYENLTGKLQTLLQADEDAVVASV